MGRDLSKAQMIVLVIACFGIFLSGFMLFKTAREYKLAEDEYAALDKFTTKVDSTALAPMSLGPVAIEEEVTEELARNYNRADFPDIDVDFDNDGRGRVLNWVTEKYGQGLPLVNAFRSSAAVHYFRGGGYYRTDCSELPARGRYLYGDDRWRGEGHRPIHSDGHRPVERELRAACVENALLPHQCSNLHCRDYRAALRMP